MSKFQVGDRVQLTEDSVNYYSKQNWITIDRDFNWDNPTEVTKVYKYDGDLPMEDGEGSQYNLKGFPFWFYEFELEYEDMRRVS